MGDFLTDLQQQFYQSFIEGDRWIRYFKGLGISFEVTLGALALGIVLGILVAVVRTAHDQQRDRKSGLLGVFNALCQIYTTVIRGTPMMVQLLIMGFVIFSASRNLVAVAILTLGINSGAYVSEIIRGGIMSIDAGQWDAGRALGMRIGALMRRIVLPQAIRRMMPAFINQSVIQFKNTSLVSVISVADLAYMASVVNGQTYRPLESYTVMALYYIAMLLPLTQAADYIEKRLAASD